MISTGRSTGSAAPLVIAALTALLTMSYLAPFEAVAQSGGGADGTSEALLPGLKQAVAVRFSGAPIRLDGRLDDDAWRDVPFMSDFLQKEPVQGAQPAERTEIGILYTETALYIGARMFSDHPEQIVRTTSRRDAMDNSERLVVSLDTFRDRRTAYSLAVTAAGGRLDWYHPEDNEFSQDLTWDPVWQARARVDSLGWTAEMRIPFSQLRFNNGREQVWGLNVNRVIPTRNEEVYWVYVPRDETGWASRFGELIGIVDVPSSSRVELSPYVASDATMTSASLIESGNPFDDGNSLSTRFGADLKMGLGPSLTLDATVNPDFGQVEADPAEVNLSAFETFFDERRPFFTEGSQLLAGSTNPNGGLAPIPGYFYSRRIGGAPPGSASGDYVDRPGVTTIIGAAKLTGRLPSGLSIGTFAATTATETASTFDSTTNVFGRTRVAPRTTYAVGRLQQEFGSSASTIGLSVTGVDRDVQKGTPLADLMTRNAFAGGVDWNLRKDGGAYELKGYVGLSYVSGDTAAIERLQRNSAHYFQRPDQDHVSFNPRRNSLTGWTGMMWVRKNAGRHWLWDASVTAVSPGFELNDAGRLRRGDEVLGQAGLWYRETEPGEIFRSYSGGIWTWNMWNFDGVPRERRVGIWGSMTMKNYLNGWLSFTGAANSLNDEMTRGGPLVKIGGFWSIDGGINTNSAATVSFNANWGIFNNPRSDWEGWNGNGGVTIRPPGPWGVSASARVNRSTQGRQYVGTFDGGPVATFGQRYVLSLVQNTDYSVQFRSNYSFTPDLSLELYAEPFVASRRFHGIGEVPNSETTTLRTYGTDGTTIVRGDDGSYTVTDGADTFTIENPDLNIQSLRSNLVLRWEWKPGSTLFVVWQQNRSLTQDLFGGRATPGDLFDSFGAAGNNFLALKATYWLSM